MVPRQEQETDRWWNDRTLFTHHFMQSTYVTAIWSWFLVLAGKVAEPVLFCSVLYSGYEVLPGVPQPGAMADAWVFVAQQATLDIGGMGLIKMAQKEGNTTNSFSYRVGFILVGLMIANVILAMLKRLIPGFGVIAAIVEGCLLVTRAIMCVIYGYAINTLKEEGREPIRVMKTSDIRERMDRYSEHLQQIERVHSQQIQQVLQNVQAAQSSIPVLVQSQSHVIIAEVQSLVQSQLKQAVQSIIFEIPELVSGQVQTLISEQVNGQAKLLLSELPLLVQSSVSEQVREVVQALDNDDSTIALQELLERLREVSTSVSEMRTTITEVRTVTQKKAVEQVEKRVSKEPIQLVHSTAKVIESGQANGQVGDRVKGYILEQRRQGNEPSLSDIMDRCDCSKGSAIRYRRELDGPDTDEMSAVKDQEAIS